MDLAQGSGFWISNVFPGDSDDTGAETTLEEASVLSTSQ